MSDVLSLLAAIFFTGYAFACGACFGSFLNVVVWRMPRKMPILLTRSHCPKCKNNIPGRDNIPIFGWIFLKGRCRSCSQPISIKYPLIETLVAVLFALIFFVLVVCHGITLPQHWPGKHGGTWLTEFPGCPLFAFSIHQMVLGYLLLAIALIDEDRMKSPWTLFLIGIISHLAILYWKPIIGQIDLPVTLVHGHPRFDMDFLSALNRTVSGGVAGALLAGSFYLLKAPFHSGNTVQQLTLVGVFLGPTVALWTAMIAGSSFGVQWINGRYFSQKKGTTTGIPIQIFLGWLLILLTWKWWPLAYAG